MATIHGLPGEWARVKGTVLGLWPLFLATFFAGTSMAIAILSPSVGALCFAMSIILGAWFLNKGLRRIERFFKGARGEERVSEILRNLPDDYHIFNDFVARGNHIDHIVIGPAGVFSIETKCWRGNVTCDENHILVDGQLPDRDPIAQALREADAVRNELQKNRMWDGPVTPLLAFASDTFEAAIADVQGVVVLNSNRLYESFATGRTVIPPQQLARLIHLVSVKEG